MAKGKKSLFWACLLILPLIFASIPKVNADSETRYMRIYYELGTEQSNVPDAYLRSWTLPVMLQWGMRVWKYNPTDGEVEITDGEPFLIGMRDVEGAGIENEPWNCPETSLKVEDCIRVRIYVKNLFEGVWWLSQFTFFRTEALGATKLDAVTWSIFSYTEFYIREGYWVDAIYRWGHPNYNSRIENFVWSIEEEVFDCNWIGINNTIAGNPTKFKSDWTDLNQSEGLSHYRFSTNNTGTWENDTWTDSWENVVWAIATKTLNSTVNIIIAFRFYVNDTSGTEYASTICFFPITKAHFFPYFGLGVVFALMIGLVFGLAFGYKKR